MHVESTGNLDIVEYGFIYYPTTATSQEEFKQVFLSEDIEGILGADISS